MKVSNHEKAQPGQEAVSRETLREWQKRDIKTQREAVKERSGSGHAPTGRKRSQKQS